MSDDVLITPASRKVEFFDSGGNIDGKIELSTTGDLNITSTGKITIGDITQDIHIGDGTQAVDLVFDFASSIYSVANQDLTIGKGSLGGNDVAIDGASEILFSLAGSNEARLTTDRLSLSTDNQGVAALFGFRDRNDMGLKSNASFSVGVLAPDNVFIQADSNNNGSSNYIDFGHGSSAVGSAESMMRIVMGGATGAGKVGIGTTSPAATVDIKTGGSGSRTSFNAVADDLVVDSTGDTGITISSSSSSTGNVFFADSDNNARGQIRYDHAGNTLRFSTSGAERFRVGSSGELGIGGATYGTSGQVLTSGGSGAAPTWEDAATGDITAVVAGNGLTGGANSGSATLNIGAGTGIDVAADAISVDVSDFMTNGVNNRVVTATGTDGMNAEANMTFTGSALSVTGTASFSGQMTAGSSSVGSYHIVSAANFVTRDGVAINGTNTTAMTSEGATHRFSSAHSLAGALANGSDIELFRFNVTNNSYRKIQGGKMYVRIQDEATGGFFQETVTFAYTGDGTTPVIYSSTDRLDSQMAGTQSSYDHEKATILVEFVSDYICVKFSNDTGSSIATAGWDARLTCTLLEMDALTL